VGAARDTATDVVEVKLHGAGVGARKHKRGAGVARRADRAEHISVGIALILGLARPRPLLGPLIDQTVLLPDRISSWNQISTGTSDAISLSADAAATRVAKFF